MALQQLLNHLDTAFPDLNSSEITGKQIYDEILNFKNLEDEKYKALKTERRVTFGKFKGFTISELCKTPKGKDYCRWLLSQSWFTEKFTDLIEDIQKEGIKKNNTI